MMNRRDDSEDVEFREPIDLYAEMERVAAEYATLPDWVKPVLTGWTATTPGCHR